MPSFGGLGGGFGQTSGSVTSANLDNFSGYASNVTGIGEVVGADLDNFSVTATVGNTGTVTAVSLDNLTVSSYGGGITVYATADLGNITSYSESGLLTPQFAVVNVSLDDFAVFSVGTPARTANVIGANLDNFAAFSTNVANIGEIVNADLDNFTAVAYQAAVISYAVLQPQGRYRLLGLGHISPEPWGLNATHGGGYTLAGYAGGRLVKERPAATLSATGHCTLNGSLVKTRPAATISASGTLTLNGTLRKSKRYPATMVGYAGGAMVATGPTATLSATGSIALVGVLEATAERATISATGTVGLAGVMIGVGPTATMVPVGRLSVTRPMATLVATGSVTVTVEYEAYSVLLGETPATTRYTNYPFDRLLRWKGRYYGMATDGLFVLEGNDFDGSPIVSTVQTGESDLDSTALKHPRALYFSGRIQDDMTISVQSSELGDNAYTYPAISLGATNHRALLGRGIRARYFSFGWSNINGGDWQLDGIEPLMDVSKRKLWT